MSRFASERLNAIQPYVPGEQPQDRQYIKLNTNENPYFTARSAVEAVDNQLLSNLKRYSDPECKTLVNAIADYYGVKSANILTSNGSDEALAFAFQAYGGAGVCFPEVTYGFYEVLANLYGCNALSIPLNGDFTITPSDYFGANRTVVIANPNAQTGIALPLSDIEDIVRNNPKNVVIIDQAYVDFGGENAIPLIKKYPNLVVVNTFSKSRSLAGARVGFIIADEKLIQDLNKVKYSFHPYNVNTLSMTLAAKAISDDDYFKSTVQKVIASRDRLAQGLKGLSFKVLPSSANFVLAKSDRIDGYELYLELKKRGVLVRHFSDERIKDYVRITVGTDEEIDVLLRRIAEIIKETK